MTKLLFILGMLCVTSVMTSPAWAQESRTPLGVQRPMPASPSARPTPAPAETPAQVVARAVAAHGAQWATGQIQSSVAAGRLTYFANGAPAATFDVTLLRKGDRQIQRIIKQQNAIVREGSDGSKHWLSAGGFSSPATRHVLDFLESQTVRSMQTLFRYQARAATLRDRGAAGNARVLETEDTGGRKTSYFIDTTTATITKLEFVTGQSKDPFSGRILPDVERYLFSDFRRVQGLLTPFKIERYINGLKAEEMQFTSVSYNASLKDDVFHP